MKLIAIAILIGISTARGMDHWQALAQVEGDCDTCIGPDGERGFLQISPRVCVEYHIESSRLWEHAYCLAWAKIIMRDRTATFVSIHHRQPTDAEWGTCWHRPNRIKLTARDLDYSRRFANLCARP